MVKNSRQGRIIHQIRDCNGGLKLSWVLGNGNAGEVFWNVSVTIGTNAVAVCVTRTQFAIESGRTINLAGWAVAVLITGKKRTGPSANSQAIVCTDWKVIGLNVTT